MPVTTKTALTRTQRRAVLRLMVRDANSATWSDAALNMCLDEGLTLVQARYPLVTSYVITLTTARSYALPAGCIAVMSVAVTSPSAATDGSDPQALDAQAFQGVTLGAAAWAVSTNQYDRVLYLSSDLAWTSGDKLLVWYRAAQQPWGDPTDVALDSVTKDLVPDALQDGEAPLLLYAGARVAAYRYAMQIIPGGGGENYEALLRIALAERDQLLDVGPRPGLRSRNGLFS